MLPGIRKGVKLGKHPRAKEMNSVAKGGQIVVENKSIDCIGSYYLIVLYQVMWNNDY